MLAARRSTSPAATGTTAALAAIALALTLGACGGATPVTVTPAGDAVTAVPTSPPSSPQTAWPTSSAPSPGADSGVTNLSVPGGGVSVDSDGTTSVSIPGGGIAIDADANPSVSIPGAGDGRIGTFGSTGNVTLKGGLEGSPTVSSARCNAAGGPRTLTATLEGGLELRVDIVASRSPPSASPREKPSGSLTT